MVFCLARRRSDAVGYLNQFWGVRVTLIMGIFLVTLSHYRISQPASRQPVSRQPASQSTILDIQYYSAGRGIRR